MTYHDDCFYAHTDTVNHPITFCDGTVKWMPMTDREKAFYQKRVEMKTQSAYVGFFHNPDVSLFLPRLADVTIVRMRNGSLVFQVVSVTNKVTRYRDLSIARMQAKKHFGSETVFISGVC